MYDERRVIEEQLAQTEEQLEEAEDMRRTLAEKKSHLEEICQELTW